MQNSEAKANTISRLDSAIVLFKDISIFGGFFIGVGMAAFYLFGIAIFAIFSSMMGVAPFEFNLQNCLETGVASFVEIITTLPMLLILGIIDNLQEATLGVYIGLLYTCFFW